MFLSVASLFLFTITTCAFGPQPFRGVMSYRGGRVFLTNMAFYRVGELPDGWGRMGTHVRTISFYNDELKSSISTDAFCGRSIEGRKPKSLEGDLLSAFDKREVVSERDFELDGRGAVRQMVRGSLDGVPVYMDLVIVRKSGCVFDFYAIMPDGVDLRTQADFEGFFGGFHYE